jgi:hypothetical protein
MSRAFILMFFAAAAVPVSASEAVEGTRDIPAFFSGERLFEICSQPNYGQCSMYVAADGEGGSRAICRTEITNQAAAELVLNRLSGDAQLRSLSAAAAVHAAIADRLSCPGPASAILAEQ